MVKKFWFYRVNDPVIVIIVLKFDKVPTKISIEVFYNW